MILHESRARIRRNRERGNSLVEKIRGMEGFTAGKLFHAKSSRIGASMLHVYKENTADQDEAEQGRENISATTYYKMRYEADAILETGFLPTNMPNAQLKNYSFLSRPKLMEPCQRASRI